MTALSAPRANQRAASNSETRQFEVASGQTVYQGSIVGVNTSGLVQSFVAETAGVPKMLGIVEDIVPDSARGDEVAGVATGGMYVVVRLVPNVIRCTVTGVAAESDHLKKVYATNNNPDDTTLTANSNGECGLVLKQVSGTLCDVLFRPYTERAP